MDTLIEQVKAAHRRLVFEQFLRRLVWALFGSLAVAAVAIAVPRLVVLEDISPRWDQLWLVAAGVAGLLIAVVWTAVRHRSTLDAAIEIDHRFDLRERVASSLSLTEEALQTEAGQALLNDALRSVSRVDVGEKFHVRATRAAWLPLAPAVVAFCLMTFVGNRSAESVPSKGVTPAEQREQDKKTIEELRKKLEAQAKEAEKKGLKDASELLKEVEKGASELTSEKDKTDRKKEFVKLNRLSDELQKKREALGEKSALQKELEDLKNIGEGPAEKAIQALKTGDWKKALEEINKIKEKMAKGEMTKEDQQKLAEQLDKLQNKLQKAAEAHKQKMEDLKKQIEQQKQQGNQAQADKLQQKLNQMQNKQQQMQQMNQLGMKMQQAQQQLQQGNPQDAAKTMQAIAEQLEKMQQQDAEMEMLDGAMEQIDGAKQQMACENCQGMGCEQCQGGGMGQMPGMGMGMGKGQGAGPRPDEENPTSMRDSRVKHDPKNGASVIVGDVEGPNQKGDVMQSVKEELQADVAREEEALTDERLPRSRREHAKEYLSKIREGL